MSFENYMDGVFKACEYKLKSASKPFVNLRLWNLDESLSEAEFNQKLFAALEKHFEIKIETGEIYENSLKSFRLAPKILLNFDRYFEWPSLDSTHETQGSCYGLQSHFGILADGVVVPCCLDGEGVIALGNLHERSLDEILHSPRSQKMIEGFRANEAVEELCKKCSYKDRFK